MIDPAGILAWRPATSDARGMVRGGLAARLA